MCTASTLQRVLRFFCLSWKTAIVENCRYRGKLYRMPTSRCSASQKAKCSKKNTHTNFTTDNSDTRSMERGTGVPLLVPFTQNLITLRSSQIICDFPLQWLLLSVPLSSSVVTVCSSCSFSHSQLLTATATSIL